jgi:hypothetical protein
MSDNLVKRLRDPAFGIETTERNLMNSAADLIEALDKTCKEWAETAWVSQRNYQRAKEAEAKLAKLVQAAEPLAKMADRYDPPEGDDDLECWSGLATPRIKHLRALRTTLASLKGDKT